MNIEFYFDPVCPFCWITSRWLLMVQPERNIEVLWKPFSLAIKNEELNNSQKNSKFANEHKDSHRIIRMILALNHHANISVIDAYTLFGINYHIVGKKYGNKLIESVLAQKKLPATLISYADDESLDKELTNNINEAIAIVGEDIGVPTIIFNNNGKKQGYFGPVLQELPNKEEALKLWDGLAVLASSETFYELKRSRPSGDPNVFSTAKC